MEKINKTGDPLLVVGLGGTGVDGLLRVKQLFAERLVPETVNGVAQDHPPRTAYLAVDTDVNVLRKGFQGVQLDREREFFNLWTDLVEEQGIMLRRRVSPECLSWLDPALPEEHRFDMPGMVTSRQRGRLALFCHADDLHHRLLDTLGNLSAASPGLYPLAHRVRVVVITGLSGFTGSGIFLDFAYLLRNAAAWTGVELNLELYVVTPDVFFHKLGFGDEHRRMTLGANGFAALKELDYWMDAPSRWEPLVPGEEFSVRYSPHLTVPWNRPPYDDVTLLCASELSGRLVEDAYGKALDTVAQSLIIDMDLRNRPFGIGFLPLGEMKAGERMNLLPDVPRRYPQFHGYRAIGISSLPRCLTQMKAAETALLMEDLLDPDRERDVEDGTWEEIGRLLRETLRELYDRMQAEMPLPEEAAAFIAAPLPGAAGGQLSGLHESVLPRWREKATGQLPRFREMACRELRDRLTQMAQRCGAEHGPLALGRLLSDPEQGLPVQVRKAVDHCEEARNRANEKFCFAMNEIRECFDRLMTAHPLFDILRKREYLSAYCCRLEDAFHAWQSFVGSRALAEALREVCDGIRREILDSRLPAALGVLEDIRRESRMTAERCPEDLQRAIRDFFGQEEVRSGLQREAFERLAGICVCGDLQGEALHSGIGRALDGVVERGFQSVNDRALQRELAGVKGSVRNHAATNLAPRLDDQARILFSAGAGFPVDGSTACLWSYVSIPAGQEEVGAGIGDWFTSRGLEGYTVEKNPAFDGVTWLNVAGGLPLCALGFLAWCEGDYEIYRHTHPGMDLMPLRLPSPNPFPALADPRNRAYEPLAADWAETAARLDRLEEGGVIALDPGDPDAPVCRIRLFMENGGFLGEEDMRERIEGITREAATPQERLAALRALREDGTVCREFRIGDPHRTGDPAANLALQLDAFRGGPEENRPGTREAAFRRLSWWILSRRPALVELLEGQLAPNRLLREAIAGAGGD